MTMTDTEAKALALVHEFRLSRDIDIHEARTYISFKALCRVIEREAATEARHAAELRELKERHEAFRQEVSDAVEGWFTDNRGVVMIAAHCPLAPFILPAPDPLVEVIAAALREASPFADDGHDYTAEAKVAAAAVRAHQKDTNA